MRQIGGERSTLYSLTREEADRLASEIKSGRLPDLQSYRDEFGGGALVGFGTSADADAAKTALRQLPAEVSTPG
jgi:hypothetical protein